MANTLVVTDSSACLPPSVSRRAGLCVLPVTVQVAGAESADGVADAETVWRAVAAGRHVWARAPSSGDYLVAAEEPGYEGVVVIAPAAEFAVMAAHARRAAAIASKPVAVIDSRTAASAQGLVAGAALDAATEGAPLIEVLERAREASTRARLIATIGGLGWLERTGNVPEAVVEAVRAGRDRPLFQVRDGSVLPIEPAAADPLQALSHAVLSLDDGPGISSPIFFHSSAPDDVARLRRLLHLRAQTVEFSLALALHTGPGVVGLAWLQDPELADPPARAAAQVYAPGNSARATSAARNHAGTTTSKRSRSTALTTARATRSA
jgi:DegV family protein with EDD domain